MNIRRSARTILITLLVLIVFTFLTAWHNKLPDQLSSQEKQALIKQLIIKNPELQLLLDKIKQRDGTQAFYVVGKRSHPPLPERISRASYSDPLAGISLASDKDVLIRYRSQEDFLLILEDAELQTPGTLKTLRFSDYKLIQESPFVISFRLLFSLLVGISGILLVWVFNRR